VTLGKVTISASFMSSSFDKACLRAVATGHLILGVMSGLILPLITFVLSQARADVATSAHPYRDYAAILASGPATKFLLAVICFYCVGNLFSGVYLLLKKRRRFSMAIAIANTLLAPLGSILGVATILLLNRPAIRDAYQA